MGLGPSTKMTTLHHYRCPLTRRLLQAKAIEFSGIILNGVSERYDDKVFSAARTGEWAEAIRLNGAIVAIDGWGNHHLDFVQVLEELGKRNIPTVAVSYIGLQGRLVCTNEYVDTVLDFNKNESGYESCIVGDNNLSDYDAMKAVALLEHKMALNQWPTLRAKREKILHQLVVQTYGVKKVQWGAKTTLQDKTLTLRASLGDSRADLDNGITAVSVRLIAPTERHVWVHTNLDFMPIATKYFGRLGEGETRLLRGVTVMLTGAEGQNGKEPSNIGSSEGYLDTHVKFGQNGTPDAGDTILHIDVTFAAGQATTVQSIRAAHRVADQIVQEIRDVLKQLEQPGTSRSLYYDLERWLRPKAGLIKLVSGLGNMYETAVYPTEPGGIMGARYLMDMNNTPVVLTPTQCLDGAIHSLL